MAHWYLHGRSATTDFWYEHWKLITLDKPIEHENKALAKKFEDIIIENENMKQKLNNL